MDPFLISAGISAIAGLFGRRNERKQAKDNTAEANSLAHKEAEWALNESRKSERDARRFNVEREENRRNFDIRQATLAEKRSDENARISRKFNRRERQEANKFTKQQNDLAYERSEKRDLRNRDWAKEDYKQQRKDFGNQFVDLRKAAEKAGFNPLTALGAQMVPSMGAGGLSSSSYGSGQGMAASSGFSTSPSVTGGSVTGSAPMAYGAPVSVAPLVSNDAIIGAVSEIGRELTGVNAIARQTDQLNRDIAQIELDQLRSGVVGYQPTLNTGDTYPTIAAGRLPHLGQTAVPAGSVSTSAVRPASGRGLNPYDPDRGVIPEDDSNYSGFWTLDNRFTDLLGGPMSLWGEGPEAEWDSVLINGYQIAATVAGRAINDAVTRRDSHMVRQGDPGYDEYSRRYREIWGGAPQAGPAQIRQGPTVTLHSPSIAPQPRRHGALQY